MERQRLRRRTVVGAVVAGLAGCVAPSGSGDTTRSTGTDSPPDSTEPPADSTDTPTASPTESETPTGSPSETDPPTGHEAALNEPDPDHDVRLRNDHDETHTVRVTVTRRSGETVYEARHEVEPGAERTVYSLAEADPAGIETFTVAVTFGETTDSVDLETNVCYGDAYAEITTEGSLYLYYEIC